jgi:hypothetical protein
LARRAVFSNGSFIALGDFNADGKTDLALTGGNFASVGYVSVMTGNGDGTFKFVNNYTTAPGTSGWIAVADYNADGKPDFAITNPNNGTISVLFRQW